MRNGAFTARYYNRYSNGMLIECGYPGARHYSNSQFLRNIFNGKVLKIASIIHRKYLLQQCFKAPGLMAGMDFLRPGMSCVSQLGHFSLNLRPGGGGAPRPPPVFRLWWENGGAQRRQILHGFSYINFTYCVEILSPGQVRSGHQVTLGDLIS